MPHPRKPHAEPDVLDDLTDDAPDDGDFDEDDFTDLGDDQPELDLSGLDDFLDDDDDDDELASLDPLADDGTDELDLGSFDLGDLDLDDDDEDDLDLPIDPLVLPWRTLAHLPDRGVDVPAVLDPTRGDSALRGPFPDGPARVRVQLDTVTFEVELARVPAEKPQLILGRDALAGRVLVSSE